MSASQHQLEQLDNGYATCIKCGASTAWSAGECEGMKPQDAPPSKPKPERDVNIPHGSKDQEIENLKRLLAHVSQRLDALKTR
jgi:hypothetical protein